MEIGPPVLEEPAKHVPSNLIVSLRPTDFKKQRGWGLLFLG